MPVIALVRFTPHIDRNAEEDREYLKDALPLFENVKGLRRKYLCGAEAGGVGVYEWASEAEALSYYDDQWHEQMKTMAGNVSVELLPVRAFIDNQAGRTKIY